MRWTLPRACRLGEGAAAKGDLGVNVGDLVAERRDLGSSCSLLDAGLTGEKVEGWMNGEGGSVDVRSMKYSPFSRVGDAPLPCWRSVDKDWIGTECAHQAER